VINDSLNKICVNTNSKKIFR